MNPTLRHAARRCLKAALLLVALEAACAAYAALRPSPAPQSEGPGRGAFESQPLPVEFAAIRPAGIDGTPPPIPPSELWPAQ